MERQRQIRHPYPYIRLYIYLLSEDGSATNTDRVQVESSVLGGPFCWNGIAYHKCVRLQSISDLDLSFSTENVEAILSRRVLSVAELQAFEQEIGIRSQKIYCLRIQGILPGTRCNRHNYRF
jgi:hypothetical protein